MVYLNIYEPNKYSKNIWTVRCNESYFYSFLVFYCQGGWEEMLELELEQQTEFGDFRGGWNNPVGGGYRRRRQTDAFNGGGGSGTPYEVLFLKWLTSISFNDALLHILFHIILNITHYFIPYLKDNTILF